MPANEFEKQVQRRLEDFELNPSASVWKKVEEQIRQKRRRRVLVLFLILAALLTGGYFSYYLWQSGTKGSSTVQHNPDPDRQNNASVPITIQQKSTDQSQQSTTKIPVQDLRITPPASQATSPGEELEVSVNKPAVSSKKIVAKNRDGDASVTDVQKPGSLTSSVRQTHNPAADQAEMSVGVAKPATTRDVNTESPKDAGQMQTDGKDRIDSLSIALKESPMTTPDSATKNEVAQAGSKPIRLPKRNYRIKWGMDFSGGVTSNQSGIFSLYKSADRSYMAATPSAASGGPAVFAIPGSPSSIKPGPAFSIGASAELQVSPRSRISSGLQYAYASNRIKKGGLVYALLPAQNTSNFSATRADQIYHGSPQNSYTNSYHFVTLPLEYHWNISRSKKLPIEWNMGLSLSYLLGTNALLYNSSFGGIYYRDKNAINKMHVSLGTGLSFRLHGSNGMEWVMGPEVYFDTRRLVNNNQDARQYLLFTGLNAKLYFGRKKQRSSSN